MNKKRFSLVLIILLFGFLIVILKAFSIQVIDQSHYQKLFVHNTTRFVYLEAKRGEIFDDQGKPIAIDYPVYNLFVDPKLYFKEVSKNKNIGHFLSYIRRTFHLNNLQNILKKHKNGEYLSLYYSLSANKYNQLKKIGIPHSFGIIRHFKRYYPESDALSHVIGFSNPYGRGIEGLEYAYNAYLEGKSEYVRVGYDPLKTLKVVKLSGGDNIYTTLNSNIAAFVHKALKNQVKKYRAKAGIAIVMKPDGAILDMDSMPSYNDNDYYKYPYKDIRNRAITDVYEPGSVLKIIDLAAALNTHIFKQTEKINCGPSWWMLDGHAIHDVESNGIITFDQVFIRSSNIGASKIALKLGKKIFYDYLYRFGFGQNPNIDTVGAEDGLVKDMYNIGNFDLANMSFGQGIGVTALQIADAYAVIANGGYRMKPYLIQKIVNSAGNIVYKHKNDPQRILMLSTVKKIRKILVDVVKKGTGIKAQIKGYEVAGKTGTAQVAMKGTYAKGIFIGSFVAFAPAYDPKFVVVVSLFDPKGTYYASDVAAPLVKKIMHFLFNYYNIPPS